METEMGGQRDLVWHLREQLGTLSVLYRLDIPTKGKFLLPKITRHPQTETLFKCLGLTFQEAIRGRGKGIKSR